MADVEFRAPPRTRWQHAGLVAIVTLMWWTPATALWLIGNTRPAIAATALGAVTAFVLARPVWRTAERVTISERAICARTYGGRQLSLPWDSVIEAQRFNRPSWRGPVHLVRLVGPGGQAVTVADWVTDFPDLTREVEVRATRARWTAPAWWEQLQWWQ